jgi:predicted RNase H-like HicB family nuclease
MKNFTLVVTVEPQEEGGYLAVCENIKQCYAEGETYEEAVENLKDVARICLELDAQREGVSLKGAKEQGTGEQEVLPLFPCSTAPLLHWRRSSMN